MPTDKHQNCAICGDDISSAKYYYIRNSICEPCSKSPVCTVNDLPKRWCQQCCKFHGLDEFDGTRRTCRWRLTLHNTRRKRTQADVIVPATVEEDDYGTDKPRMSTRQQNQHHQEPGGDNDTPYVYYDASEGAYSPTHDHKFTISPDAKAKRQKLTPPSSEGETTLNGNRTGNQHGRDIYTNDYMPVQVVVTAEAPHSGSRTNAGGQGMPSFSHPSSPGLLEFAAAEYKDGQVYSELANNYMQSKQGPIKPTALPIHLTSRAFEVDSSSTDMALVNTLLNNAHTGDQHARSPKASPNNNNNNGMSADAIMDALFGNPAMNGINNMSTLYKHAQVSKPIAQASPDKWKPIIELPTVQQQQQQKQQQYGVVHTPRAQHFNQQFAYVHQTNGRNLANINTVSNASTGTALGFPSNATNNFVAANAGMTPEFANFRLMQSLNNQQQFEQFQYQQQQMMQHQMMQQQFAQAADPTPNNRTYSDIVYALFPPVSAPPGGGALPPGTKMFRSPSEALFNAALDSLMGA